VGGNGGFDDARGAKSPRLSALGPYRIEGELGRGGMGVVYLARDTRLDRAVAIKMLPESLARDPEQLARFQREARLLASINHPNIATIHGLEQSERGDRFIVLERLEGETLAERLRRGALPLDEAIGVCAQIAEALEAAHERGVIHRDLKPGNVMLGPRGRVKVLDFGLAKHIARAVAGQEPADASRLTEAGVVIGTPGYMSPEQVLAQPHDRRVDIFAFGCVLYECLTGRRAFGGENLGAVTAAVLAGDPDWSALPADTPEAVRALLARCMAKDPAERPEDAAQALREMGPVASSASLATARAIPVAAGPRHNLPRQLTSFVGRERELADCARLLDQARLLTLTGAGGCGKTRLALRIAEAMLDGYPGGVWFVDLAPLTDASRVAHAVAAAVGVREEPGKSPAETLAAHLAPRRALVVLDNCEHLLHACADLVATLLAAGPGLRVVATSREGLAVAGEQAYAVPSLALPPAGAAPPLDVVAASESVRLFVERARLQQSEFEIGAENAAAVAEICRRLDGIPLAIELAAARVKVLAVEEIRAKLDDRFRLLTGGSKTALPRHQTLRATIQWSYDHLSAEERDLLRGLAVFAGGWTLAAAAAVCGAGRDEFEVLDLLSHLVDKSLVLVASGADDGTRYRFLETMRQYALEKLDDAGEGAAMRSRHLEHFHALAERAEPALWGSEQGAWLARLELEHENLLAALAWCDLAEDGADRALRLAGSLWRFWTIHGHYRLGRRALDAALARTGTASPGLAHARALYGAGYLALWQGESAAGRALFERSLAIARALDDRQGAALSLSGLGLAAKDQGDYAAARAFYEESLALYREVGQKRGVAAVLNNLAAMAWAQGDAAAARPLYEEGAAIGREAGDRDLLVVTLTGVGWVATRTGHTAEARERLLECLRLVGELGAKLRGAYAIEAAGALAATLSERGRATRLYGAAEALREVIGAPADTSWREAQAAIVDELKRALGAEGFARRWASGRALPFESALEYAIEWLAHGPETETPAAP
jgi:predicted ATPase/predicted Ser/Thr protein kinase